MIDTSVEMMRAEFFRRWGVNQRGGPAARLSRWRNMHHLLLQRLGWQRWVRGRVFWGDPMWLCTGETVSKGLLAFGYSECALTSLMLEALRPGMRFIDVGAHVGYESMLAAIIVGESGRVVSFEPQRQLARYAHENLKLYPWIRQVPSAVGDHTGITEFKEQDVALSAFSAASVKNANDSGRRYQVPVTTVDDALEGTERPVDFIKCDTEGGEMAVLRGAVGVLRSDRPLLVLEGEMPTGSARPRLREFVDFLAPFGYQALAFEFDGAFRVGRIEELRVGHANVAFVHP